MRLFNSGAAASMMNRPGVPDDTAIESKIVSRAIQSAQSQVEGRNAEIRKNVLKYDDVMSRQREAIYNDRRHILEGDDIQSRIAGFLNDVVTDIVNQHIVEGSGKDWDLEALWNDLKTVYPVGLEISEVLAEAGNRSRLTRDWLTRELVSDAKVAYEKRTEQIGEAAMRELERRVVLSVVDRKWRDHLYEMDYLKEGIGLRAMAQRDPLVEYQREGYGMFQQMMGAIKEEAIGFMFNIEVQVQAAESVEQIKPDVKKLTYTSPSEDGSAEVHQGGSGGPVKPNNGKPDDKSGKGSSFFRN
jgi:preprotein translocase subunit SecA